MIYFPSLRTGDVSPRSASIHFVTLGHHPPSPLKWSVQSYPAFRRNILPLSSREDCTNVRTQKATIWLDASTSHFFRTWMFSAPEGRYVKHKHAVENLEQQFQLKNEMFVWNNLKEYVTGGHERRLQMPWNCHVRQMMDIRNCSSTPSTTHFVPVCSTSTTNYIKTQEKRTWLLQTPQRVVLLKKLYMM